MKASNDTERKRVVVIGGTGHIGSYLVPRLVESGYDVVSVSRGSRNPYRHNSAWSQVEQVEIDRRKAEKEGTFGDRIRKLEPEVVMDLICYTPESAEKLVNALRSKVQHLILCGTIWIHGPSESVPTSEEENRKPIGGYGRKKATIEKILHREARQNGFPATVLHPGHIVGEGWAPLNPTGNFDTEVFADLSQGKEVAIPNLGMETVHHVHADDVAQAFLKSAYNWNDALGESFHITSPRALTLRGYAESMAEWFGQEANLNFLPLEEWEELVSEERAETTKDHIFHSPNCSIKKASDKINYQPRYSSLQAVKESVSWLIENGELEV